ncbi:MAG: hypothetical protein ABIA04_08395 [Pseudomonadota bacterium]
MSEYKPYETIIPPLIWEKHPVPIAEAFKWLEKYRAVMRICYILFEDRSVLWLEPNSFCGYDKTDKTYKKSGTFIQINEGPVNISLNLDFDKKCAPDKQKRKKKPK